MAEHEPLPDSINPNYFPAKLWSLVNDPANEAVQWDSSGRLVIINQQLLESQVLAPGAPGAAGAHGFKTSNFSSFVRQLNLYGFKKVDAVNQDRLESLSCRYFCNENFQRNRPELVASLRRFTVGNKTRLQAGLDLNTRFPSRSEVQGGGQQVTKESLSLLRSAQEILTSSHLSSPSPAPRPHSGTPMPPKSMKRVHFGALSSPDDAAGPFKTSYTGVPSPGNHPYHHQGFPTPAKHAGSRFYQHGYYRPVCHSCHSNITTSQIPGLQTGFIPPKNYYQAGFLVNKSSNKGLQEKENQDKKICDVNLDKVFEVADEVMQSFCSSRLVPVKTSVVAAPSSTSCGAAQHKNTQTAVYAANAPSSSVVFKQEEASAPSPHQQGPENEGFVQTPADPAPEEETINVEVWDS